MPETPYTPSPIKYYRSGQNVQALPYAGNTPFGHTETTYEDFINYTKAHPDVRQQYEREYPQALQPNAVDPRMTMVGGIPHQIATLEAQKKMTEDVASGASRYISGTSGPTVPVGSPADVQLRQPQQPPQQPFGGQGGTIVGIGAPGMQQQQPQPPQASPMNTQWAFNSAAGKWLPLPVGIPTDTTPLGNYNMPGEAGGLPISMITPPQTASTSPVAPPAPQQPAQTGVSPFEDALKRYEEAIRGSERSAAEQDAEKKVSEYLAQLDALEAQKRTEQARTGLEPVAMPFITGRQEAIERMASTRAGEIGAKAAPLQRQLAQLQAEREGKRQAAIDISKTRLEATLSREKEQASQQRFEREQALKEKEFAMKPIPETPEQKAGIDLILKGYSKVTAPNQLKGLTENDIVRVGKDIYKKPVAERKFTEVSPGATLYDPATGKPVFTAPTAKQLGGGGGDGTPEGLKLTPAQINSTVNSIAGAFDNEPIVKSYNVTQEGYQTVKSIGTATKSPADDIAFIYAFAKIMDPNSVVREGEYATIQRYAQTWADNFGFKTQRIFSNTNFLSPDAKNKMLNALKPKVDTIERQYKNLKGEYQRQVDDAYAGRPRQITGYEEGNIPSQTTPSTTSKYRWGPGAQQAAPKAGTTSSGLKYTIE